jgi:3-oxoacyl-[acyl-carrier-protein] synthase II
MPERIAITGVGVVTSIAIGADAFAKALRCGRSGVGRITAFDCRDFDTQIAAEIAADALCVGDYVTPPKMV